MEDASEPPFDLRAEIEEVGGTVARNSEADPSMDIGNVRATINRRIQRKPCQEIPDSVCYVYTNAKGHNAIRAFRFVQAVRKEGGTIDVPFMVYYRYLVKGKGLPLLIMPLCRAAERHACVNPHHWIGLGGSDIRLDGSDADFIARARRRTALFRRRIRAAAARGPPSWWIRQTKSGVLDEDTRARWRAQLDDEWNVMRDRLGLAPMRRSPLKR